jgi:hypothetical protein
MLHGLAHKKRANNVSDIARTLKVLDMLIDDCTTDVEEFDGKPFTGKTVGELHGILEAKFEALAKIVKQLVLEEGKS